MLYNLHTHQSSDSKEVLEIVNQYPYEFNSQVPFFSIGIHPWYIDINRTDEYLQKMEELLLLPNCLAVGECGLDKRIDTPLEIQQEIFENQLMLAQKHKKPVILHCVAAYQEVMAIKKKMNIKEPMIVHGFSKNLQVAQSLLENGFYLSFGKYLLRNPELASVFLQVPDDCFLLETDTISDTISAVYEKAASIKKIDIEKQVSKTFTHIFKI